MDEKHLTDVEDTIPDDLSPEDIDMHELWRLANEWVPITGKEAVERGLVGGWKDDGEDSVELVHRIREQMWNSKSQG